MSQDARPRRFDISSDPAVRQFIEIEDHGEHGLEVVLRVVNEGEAPLTIFAAQVAIEMDGRSLGEHEVGFKRQTDRGGIELEQFEIAQGHFHLPPDAEHHRYRFRVTTEMRRDGHDEARRMYDEIDTRRIQRK
jgi:hypothetical protein